MCLEVYIHDCLPYMTILADVVKFLYLGRSRRSNCVKEVERLKQNRENRRLVICALKNFFKDDSHVVFVLSKIWTKFSLTGSQECHFLTCKRLQ